MKEEKGIGVDGDKNVVLELGDETALDERFFFCEEKKQKMKLL